MKAKTTTTSVTVLQYAPYARLVFCSILFYATGLYLQVQRFVIASVFGLIPVPLQVTMAKKGPEPLATNAHAPFLKFFFFFFFFFFFQKITVL
ncbi:hypothetical protein V8C37DRAFT_378654, partial [Trichoderma ceciliae]